MTEGNSLFSEDELIEAVKDAFFKYGKPGIITDQVYDILVSRGEIDLSEEEEQITLMQVERHLLNDAERGGPKELRELARIKGTFLYEAVVKKLFKKHAVANYFTKQKLMDDF